MAENKEDVLSHLLGQDGAKEEAVRVFVRIRPLNKREKEESDSIEWKFDDTSMIEDTQNGVRVYSYDQCFNPNSTNLETYITVGKPVVLKAMEGFNGTVFTYGQTGSGKTWTMRGSDNDPGMMRLCVKDILDWIDSHPDIQFKLKVAYFEVYNEEINDLLGGMAPSSRNLKIVSEDPAKGVTIGGLIEESVMTPDCFMHVLERGESARSYASTSMNAESSRSHTIYRVAIERLDKKYLDDKNATTRISYINLVDLAGSERQKSTNTTGKTLKEGSNINKSLLALGAVINKLGENSKKSKKSQAFIPYRDSKLTRILKQSLGGNTLTSVLCAISPAPMNREETVSTLKFGQLCKTIKNTVTGNEGIDEKMLIDQLRNTVLQMKEQLESQSGCPMMQQIIREKQELEEKVKGLEDFVMGVSGDVGDGEDINIGDVSIGDGKMGGKSTITLFKSLQDAKSQIKRLSEKNDELNCYIAVLKTELGDYQELEESKAAFDEYQRESMLELEDERAKIEKDKQVMQADRYKMLNERSSVEEKESRLGTLFVSLDERDSRLRQTLATLKEQQEHWKNSVDELKHREDLVDDWQKNHHIREKRLQEMISELEMKGLEVTNAQNKLAELEQKFKLRQRELQEREQRLQIALSRVADSEQVAASNEEKFKVFEIALRKREADCDMKERDLTSRWKEMEAFDIILRDKERKLSSDQVGLEQREDTLKLEESLVETRNKESDFRTLELKQLSEMIELQSSTNTRSLATLDAREASCEAKESELTMKEEQLELFEATLLSKEIEIRALEIKFKDVSLKEIKLNDQIEKHSKIENEFYDKTVAEISSNHSKQVKRLENIISQQLKMVDGLQAELKVAEQDSARDRTKVIELSRMLVQKDETIRNLHEVTKRLSDDRENAEKVFFSLRLEREYKDIQQQFDDDSSSCEEETDDINVDTNEAEVLLRSGIYKLAETERIIGKLLDVPLPSSSQIFRTFDKGVTSSPDKINLSDINLTTISSPVPALDHMWSPSTPHLSSVFAEEKNGKKSKNSVTNSTNITLQIDGKKKPTYKM